MNGPSDAREADECARIRAELDAIYDSRAWRAVTLARRILGPVRSLRMWTSRRTRGERPEQDDAATTEPPASWPLVSVVIPVYEDTTFLHETLTSIAAQTYPFVETILVDDGSAPAAAGAIASAAQASGARLVRLPRNQGLPAARNAGAGVAAGEYILPLDADDTVAPWSVEEMVWALHAAPGAAFAYPSVRSIGHRTAFVEAPDWDASRLGRECFLAATALISRAAFDAVAGYDEKRIRGLEDWDLWLRMASRGWYGVPVRGEQFIYRRRADSMLEGLVTDGTLNALRAEVSGRHPDPTHADRAPAPREAGSRALVETTCRGPAKHVLLLVPFLTVGGADRLAVDIVAGLTTRGHAVSVIGTAAGPNEWASRAAAHTPLVFHLPDFLPAAAWLAFLEHHIESRRVGAVLIAHSEWGYRQARLLRARFPKLLLADFQHYEVLQWEGGGFPAIAQRDAGDVLDVRLAVSDSLAARLVEAYGARPATVRVVRLGTDVAALRDGAPPRDTARKAMELADDAHLVVFLGRLCRQKRPDLAVSAFAAAVGLAPEREFRMLVVGAPEPEWDALARTTAAALGVSDRIVFAGATDDVGPVLAAADVLILPSEFEAHFPLAAQEAIAFGVPVVAADVGGLRDAIPAEMRSLVPWGPAMARRLGEALLTRVVDGRLTDRAAVDATLDPLTPARQLDVVEEALGLRGDTVAT